MANDIFNGGNCGVVGCWGTDAQGRKTLNGKLYEGMFSDFNKINEEDLKDLKKVEKQKVVFTKPFATYKVGDVLEVKLFNNTHQSEPPSFLVIDEKLGSDKYGFGGRGSSPFFEAYTGNVLKKYIFKEDYEANGSNFIPSGSQQASVMLKYSFKKGDVFEGEKIPTNSGVETGSTAQYNVNITTPEALKADGTKWSGKAIFEVPEMAVIEQALTSKGQSFFQQHKNHLLIIGAVVIGYFAYKKFNK